MDSAHGPMDVDVRCTGVGSCPTPFQVTVRLKLADILCSLSLRQVLHSGVFSNGLGQVGESFFLILWKLDAIYSRAEKD